MYPVFTGRYCSAPVSVWLRRVGTEQHRRRRHRRRSPCWSLLIHLAFLISSQTKTSRTSRLIHSHREDRKQPHAVTPPPSHGRITLADPWLALIYHHRRNDLPGPNKKLARAGRTDGRTDARELEGGRQKEEGRLIQYSLLPSFRARREGTIRKSCDAAVGWMMEETGKGIERPRVKKKEKVSNLFTSSLPGNGLRKSESFRSESRM